MQEDKRILELNEQLSRSRADLESTSARFKRLADQIPADVTGLSDRLSNILVAAAQEAEDIHAEALRFAETVRAEAEGDAARIITEAKLEYQSAIELRVALEAATRQTEADIAHLRKKAALNAAEILAEAKKEAEDTLARVQRDVDAQISRAQARLDELSQVRANIVAQVNGFYERFNRLDVQQDQPIGPGMLPIHVRYAIGSGPQPTNSGQILRQAGCPEDQDSG